jgi:hypothetical protein
LISNAPIPYPNASHSNMNLLPKSSVFDTGVEDMTYFQSENAKITSSFHTNEFLFKRDATGYTMHA